MLATPTLFDKTRCEGCLKHASLNEVHKKCVMVCRVFYFYFSFAHKGAKLQTFCTVKNLKSVSSLAITRIVYLTLLLKEA